MSRTRINTLEKSIRGKMLAISDKTVTPAESGIGKLINSLKSLDEPLHDELMAKYKETLAKLKKDSE